MQSERIPRAELAADAMDSRRRPAETLSFARLEQDACSGHDLPATLLAPAQAAAPVPEGCLLYEIADRDAERLALWRPDGPRAVVPLVAVRAHLVTRRGLGGLEVAWDGTPIFAAAGWGAPQRGGGDKGDEP